MKKMQLIVSAVAIVAILGLYMLPTVVLDNDKGGAVGMVEDAGERSMDDAPVSLDVSDADRQLYDSLYNLLGEKFEPQAFAPLVAVAIQVGRFGELLNEAKSHSREDNGAEWLRAIGDAAYEAFNFVEDVQQRNELGNGVRETYGQLRAQYNPADSLDLKVRMGVTLVSSKSPMQGIMMIREVLNVEADNVSALYNLGLLSMQSGQYAKAKDRFARLLELDASNEKWKMLYAVTLKELGELEEAKAVFKQLVESSTSEEISTAAQQYLSTMQH